MTTTRSANSLRVLQIVAGLDIGSIHGGADRFGADLACALQAAGCQVAVAAFFRTGTPREESTRKTLEEAGLEVFFAAVWDENIHMEPYLKGLSTLSSHLGGRPVDIAHSHFSIGSQAAIFLKLAGRARKSLRTVHLAHQWESRWYTRLRHALLASWIYPLALDAEVGVSQAIVDGLQGQPGAALSGHRPVKIFNALPLPPPGIRPQPKEMSQQGKTAPVIGTVARLEEQKGITYLLQAVPAILQSIPGARFWIIGQGSLREELEAQARQSGIGEAVQFLGQRSDVLELVKQMDLFVLPSLWEGLPTVVLESMACGVPVIATDIPGTREIIQPQVNGWLVPPRDPAALARAIQHGLEQPAEGARLAGAAQAMLEQFSMPVIAARYLELYHRLLGD